MAQVLQRPRFQKWRTTAWQRRYWRNIGTLWSNDGWSGEVLSGFLVKKWPGVNTSRLSEASGRSINSLKLKQAFILAVIIVYSSNINLVSTTTFLRLFWVVQYSTIVLCQFQVHSLSYSSLISLAAPSKSVPWSLQTMDGFPHRVIKCCCSRARKAAVVRSETTSKWTALVAKRTSTVWSVGFVEYWFANRARFYQKQTGVVHDYFVTHKAQL